MSDYLSTELAATCAALGYYDGSKYHLDNYCLGKSSCYFLCVSCILNIHELVKPEFIDTKKYY